MDAFEDLEVWKRSSRLCVELYSALALCRDAGFKDQVTRAALSVPSNIAEGYERDSKRELMRFLRIAKGSCGELRTQLYIGSRIGYIRAPHCRHLIAETWELSRMLHGLIQSVARTGTESET
ncbi:MAG TPA: four helix bundle protein [Thiohalobacter sp.]|nr:four helix bundle protein [Thiohalobacter sp.]